MALAVDEQFELEQVLGSENTWRMPVVQLDQGLSTRTFPHLQSPRSLAIADNVFSIQDGLPSKRPGNGFYGASVNGKIGSGLPVASMTRFYYTAGAVFNAALLAQSGTGLYRGNDNTGAWTLLAGLGVNANANATFAPIFDQDWKPGAGAVTPSDTLIICDGVNVPRQWDGINAVQAVPTGAGNLPTKPDGATPITPKYAIPWNQSLVYAGDSADPQTIWISDAAHPTKFTGIRLTDSAGAGYFGVWPAGRTTRYGFITGLAVLGATLIVFFQRGVVFGINTGSYGAFQYQWTVRSGPGCVAPRSIVEMEFYVVFFGGDRFYATDGTNVVALPDEIPTFYSNNARSARPPEIKAPTTVFGVRRGTTYWASYDAGVGHLERILVFDTAAGEGGWTYGSPSGGAWWRWPSGMTLGAAIECRSGTDAITQPLFWGSSVNDVTAQFDVGTFDDFGAPIAIEIRTKSFFFSKPLWAKTCQALYGILVFPVTAGAYTVTPNFYAVEDLTVAPAPPVTVTVNPSGVVYGSSAYGTFTFQAAGSQAQVNIKSYPAQVGPCVAIAFGMTESSTHPLALIGFEAEVTLDPPY